METFPSNPFWEYSVTAYTRPGVEQACLTLQERLGVDVNLLLFCCWAGGRGHRLTDDELATLISLSEPWQDSIVRPLRDVRRRLESELPVPPDLAGRLREEVIRNELHAERIEQLVLAETVRVAMGEATADLCAENLRAYLRVRNIRPDTTDTADLAVIMTGSFTDLLPLEAIRLLA